MGAATPLVTDVLATKVTGNFALSTEADGGITLLEAVDSGGDIEVSFQFNVADSYPGNLRDVVLTEKRPTAQRVPREPR